MNVLVVVAHPDDEVLGCGGTIVKHIKAGDEVYVLVLADGATSRLYDPCVSRVNELKMYKKMIDIRQKEFIVAAKIMGIKRQNLIRHNLPDQRLDAIPLLDIIKMIENCSREVLFDFVYTHHWGDLNKDHRVCFEAVLTAFRPRRQKIKSIKLYCFEIPGNMNLLPPFPLNRFRPNYFVDITNLVGLKIKALKAYRSELRNYPDFLSPESILILAKKMGRNKGYKFAEAFEEIR